MKNLSTKNRIYNLIITVMLLISFNSCVMVIYSGSGTLYSGKSYSQNTKEQPEKFKKYINYSGTFSPDGKQFFFTSNRIGSYIENVYDTTKVFNTSHDIWYVNVISNENDTILKFDTPKNINEIMETEGVKSINKINTRLGEGSPCFSGDGRFMYFSACNRPTGLGSCDIFVSENINGKWTTPYILDSNINSRNFDSEPFISKDSKKMLFISTRFFTKYSNGQDIFSNYNIWESYFDETTKTWSKAQIIQEINSKFTEMSPSLSDNGDTLYFTTTRFSQDSTFDIAYSVFDYNQKRWSKPIKLDNLNSNSDDMLFKKSSNNKYIILNTRREDIESLQGVLFNSSKTWISNQDSTVQDDMKIIILKNQNK